MRAAKLALAFGATVLAARASAHPAIAVLEDSKGNVYFSDLAQVWRVDPKGILRAVVPGVHSHELCLDGSDNLFGEHLWYEGDATKKWGHRVWKMSPDGTVEDVLPATEGFLADYSFVRDAAGAMYWAGDGEADPGPRTTVKKRAPDGTVTTLAGPAGFTDIRWMAASPAGSVYAVDIGSVKRVDPDGKVMVLATSLDDADKRSLMGLWPAADGSVYVTNPTAKQVKKIRTDGTVVVVARSSGGWAPTGVSLARNGDLLVLESQGNRARVRRIAGDGRERVFAP